MVTTSETTVNGRLLAWNNVDDGARRSECAITRLGHLLLGLVPVQADGEPEHNFFYICTNVMSFELFDERNNYFECIDDEK